MATLPVSSDRRPFLDVPRRAGGLHGFLGVHPGLLVLALAALFAPTYLSTFWVYTVTGGLVLAISCLGLLVVVGWVREISLAQAGLTGSAACLAFYALRIEGLREGGLPFPLAAAYAIGGVAALSLLVALVCMRLGAAYVVVLTLALQFALENTVLVSQGSGKVDLSVIYRLT